MHLFLEILIDGFVIGDIYALGAAGLTIIFGVAGVINLSHGSIMVLAALVAWYCTAALNINIYLAALIGILAAIVTSYLLYFLVVLRLERSRRISEAELEIFIFVATLLVALILGGLLEWGFGSSPVTTPPLVQGIVPVGGVRVPANELFLAGVAWFVLCALWLFITRTKLGKAMLAASMSPTGLAIVGYDIGRIHALVWGLYGLLAGVEGVLLASFLGASPTLAVPLTASALTIVILGGLGNVPGSLAAAYILGYVGTITAYMVSPSIRALPGLGILVLVLYLRPQGLFGRH